MKKTAIIYIGILFLAITFLPLPAYANEKWEGVDVAVIEKTAGEQGRPAAETPFNSLEGDMLLFAFLVGGAAGGFCAGYFYRKLTETGDIQGNA